MGKRPKRRLRFRSVTMAAHAGDARARHVLDAARSAETCWESAPDVGPDGSPALEDIERYWRAMVNKCACVVAALERFKDHESGQHGGG